MRISIIYGTEPNSFIYTQVHLLLDRLNVNLNTAVNEFFISQDMPKRTSFDWYTFFIDEMINSDYKKSLKKISNSLYKSDLIILVSSVHSKLKVNQINNLLNHLSYEWMPHKRTVTMSNKIAVILSDSPNFSFDIKNRILSKNLRFWGIRKDCIFKKAIIYNKNSKLINSNYKNNIDLNNFISKLLEQYKRSYKIITPNFNLTLDKRSTLNISHTRSQKSYNKKKHFFYQSAYPIKKSCSCVLEFTH